MFVRALRLRHLTARHVMTPRVDVRALNSGATVSDVVDLTRDTGMSQFPVYSENLDRIIGAIHLKRALAVPVDRRATVTVMDLTSEPILVPESLAADHLLDRLREEETMAVVLDEYGDTVGIVTLEDIVEEVVGSVSDEHDTDESDPLVALDPTADGRPRWQADGIIRTDQLASLGLPDTGGSYETLAGLIADRLDRIPVPGDRIDRDGWLLEVEAVSHHVAERVQITGPHPSDGDAPDRDRDRLR